jgi:SAM-dependent methyltransferase
VLGQPRTKWALTYWGLIFERLSAKSPQTGTFPQVELKVRGVLMDKNRETAGHEYFSQLYGATSKQGEPQQTVFDKWRDKILFNTYATYSTHKLSQSDVLDVGCGYGWLLDAFEGARTLSGVDIAHHAVEVAAGRKPDRFFKQGDLQDPSPFSQKFDLILAINIVEHLSDPEAGIQSISKSAKPGAIVLVHMPTISNWLTRWEYSKLYDSDPTHIYRPSGKTVRKLFEAEGFETLRDSYLPHFPAALTKLWPVHPAYLAVFKKSQ